MHYTCLHTVLVLTVLVLYIPTHLYNVKSALKQLLKEKSKVLLSTLTLSCSHINANLLYMLCPSTNSRAATKKFEDVLRFRIKMELFLYIFGNSNPTVDVIVIRTTSVH